MLTALRARISNKRSHRKLLLAPRLHSILRIAINFERNAAPFSNSSLFSPHTFTSSTPSSLPHHPPIMRIRADDRLLSAVPCAVDSSLDTASRRATGEGKFY